MIKTVDNHNMVTKHFSDVILSSLVRKRNMWVILWIIIVICIKKAVPFLSRMSLWTPWLKYHRLQKGNISRLRVVEFIVWTTKVVRREPQYQLYSKLINACNYQKDWAEKILCVFRNDNTLYLTQIRLCLRETKLLSKTEKWGRRADSRPKWKSWRGKKDYHLWWRRM